MLAPNDATGWEENTNRPVAIRQGDGYHLWYAGQTRDRSWIGYATSDDGRVWLCGCFLLSWWP